MHSQRGLTEPLADCAIRAPHSHTIHSHPSSTPASSSPQATMLLEEGP
jgi:hypothetical protein